MRGARTILAVAAAALAAALLLPFLVNVNLFRAQVTRALGAGLGRPVEAASIRLKLLSGPGFDLRNVTIGEDPAFGIEPFARMPTLRATVRLRSLWTGRLAFSSLVFVEPSVNLGRNAAGRWNVESLVARAGGGSRLLAAPPYLELQDARVNFKWGDIKSVFFLSDVDAALFSTDGGLRRLHLRLTGSPARTDRTLTEVGELRAEGSFGPISAAASGAPPTLRMQVELRDASLADLLVLASGAERQIHGVLDLRAVLEGEPAALRASGAVRFYDLHRWDLLPSDARSAFDLRFEALLDAPARRLRLSRLEAALGAGQLEGAGEVAHLPDRPSYHFEFRFSGARAATVLGAARHFASRPPRTLRLGGTLSGELAVHGPPLVLGGFVTGRDLDLQDAALPRLRAPEARAEIAGTALKLQPVLLELGRGQNLTLAAEWDWDKGHGEFSVAGRDLPLRGLIPLLDVAGFNPFPNVGPQLAEGRVALNLRAEVSRQAAPRLSGWGQLARARWALPAQSAPVLLHTARLDFQGDQVRASRLVASWAGSTITGSLRIPLRSSPAYIAELSVDECDASAMAAALRPVARRSLPLLFRASGAGTAEGSAGAPVDGASEPSTVRAEGRLKIGRVRLRRLLLDSVQADFRLAGRRLQLDRSTAAFSGGTWAGSAVLDFSAGAPAYRLTGRIRNASLAALAALSASLQGTAAGQASGLIWLTSSGWTSPEVLDNLSMRMRLEGHDLVLRNVDLEGAAGGGSSGPAGLSQIERFTAHLAVERGRIRLQQALLVAPSATFQATGTVGFDQAADFAILPMNDARAHAFRLVGRLDSPQVRPAAGPEGERAVPAASRSDR